MKIALNIEAVGARRGGAEKYAGTLARWLSRLGQEVHVFAREVDRDELPPGTPVHVIGRWRVPGFGWLRCHHFARASEQALRGERFDLIIGLTKVWHQHVHLAVGGAYDAVLAHNSQRFRSPLLRGLWWFSKAMNLKQWIFRGIARRQFHGGRPPRVIAPSRLVAEHFQRYHGVPPEHISIVYNALDRAASLPDAAAARAAFRREQGLTDEHTAVLFVARNYALKGLSPLLGALARVAAEHPRARLIVCGSRRDAAYRRQARRLGIADRVHWLGFVEDVRACFAGSDVFAFPTFYDPCSLVVLEAMAAGLPVVTTRQNGAGELLREGIDGYVIDSPWALDQLADKLGRLVSDADLRRRLGSEAQARVQAYTVESQEQQLLVALRAAAAEAALETKQNLAGKPK